MREMVIDKLLVVLLNLREPGKEWSLNPTCVHWQNTVLDARTAVGDMIVSTAYAQ